MDGTDENEGCWDVLNGPEEEALAVVREAVGSLQDWPPGLRLERIHAHLQRAGATRVDRADRADLYRLGGACFRLRINPQDSSAVDVLFEARGGQEP